MKYYLALLILMCNALCYGQDTTWLDNVISHDMDSIKDFHLDDDSTHMIIYYFKDGVGLKDTIEIYPPRFKEIEDTYMDDQRTQRYTSTIFDSIIIYGSGTTAEVKNPKGITLNTETFTTTPVIDTTSAIIYSRRVKAKTDTLKVLLLYSDTSSYEAIIYGIEGKQKPMTMYDNDAKWGYFYSVREQEQLPPCSKCWPAWKHLYYLDQNKKKLSDNILIWQFKEIEQ